MEILIPEGGSLQAATPVRRVLNNSELNCTREPWDTSLPETRTIFQVHRVQYFPENIGHPSDSGKLLPFGVVQSRLQRVSALHEAAGLVDGVFRERPWHRFAGRLVRFAPA